MSYKYRLTYKLKKHPKGIAKEKIPSGWGGTDAVLFCSILYPPDGSLSIYYAGLDGRTKGPLKEDLKDVEWFKVWTLLANRLAASKTLSPDKTNFCREVFESMRVKLLGFSLN